MDEVFVVGRARSSVFFVVRDAQAREEDEVENECAEPQLMSRKRDDFNRFIVTMLAEKLHLILNK